MKKMISLLSVALFALTFAAGCGKHTKCDQAKTKADCAKEKFEKPDDFKCVWTPKADAKTDEEKNKNGTCAEPAANANTTGTTGTWKAAATSAAECDAQSAGPQATCEAVVLTAAATDKCAWDAAAVTPAKKCAPAQK